MPPDMRPAARRVYDYLESLQTGLADWAWKQDWRVDEALWWADPGGTLHQPYLLVPDRTEGARLVVRGYRIRPVEDAGTGPPYDDSAWVADRNAPDWADVPVPHVSELLARRFAWVCRDPADALLLHSHDITAVSLASPCDTLGSEEGVRRLAGLNGARQNRKPPKGTIVVVDPGAELGERGGYLRGFFERVLEVRPELDSGGSLSAQGAGRGLSVTGPGLAHLVRSCEYPTSDPVSDLEAVLLAEAVKVGDPCQAARLPLDNGAKEPGGGVKRVDEGATRSEASPLAPRRVQTSTAAEIKAAGREGGEWLLKPFLQPGRYTDIQGEAQIGKSTFLLALTSAVAEGADFLEESSAQSDVLYVTEQSQDELRDNLETSKQEHPRVHFLNSDDYLGMSFPTLVAHVDALRREHEARLVVFDTVFNIVEMTGGQTGSRKRINELFATLWPLTASGAAVLLVRHGVDEGGSQSKTGDGPRAYNGRVSTSVRFRTVRHHNYRRKLEVNSRRLGKFDLAVDWSPAGFYERVGPSTSGGEKVDTYEPDGLSDLDRAVLKALDGIDPPGLISKEIVPLLANKEGQGPKRTAVDKSLVRLIERELVVRTKSTEGRLLYRYALARP